MISNEIFDARKAKVKAKFDTDLAAEDLKAIIADYKKLVEKKTGKPFPQEALEQLSMARDAVFPARGTDASAIEYRRIRGTFRTKPRHRGECAGDGFRKSGRHISATGVGFTRNPGYRREDPSMANF